MNALHLYHGTTTLPFDDFMKSERGSLGSGHYFTSDLHTAYCFAGEEESANVAEVVITMTNPLSFKAREGVMLDSWGEPLVLELFEMNEAAAILEKAAWGSGDFGAEIEEALRRKGHDGAICEFPDGSLEVNALNAAAIEIVRWRTGDEVKDELETSEIIRSAHKAQAAIADSIRRNPGIAPT